MDDQELSQEIVDDSVGTADGMEDNDSGGVSFEDDFQAIFGDAEGGDDEGEDEEVGEGTTESPPEAPQGVNEQGEQLPTLEAEAPVAEEETPQVEAPQDGMTPPARLTAQEKKLFSNIKSKTLRKSIQKMFKDHESGQAKALNEEKAKLSTATQTQQRELESQYRQASQQVQGIRQAVEPYLDKLTFNGKIPISQGIGELAATHAKLSSADPGVAVPELKRIAGYLAKRFNTEPEQIFSVPGVKEAESTNEMGSLQKQNQEILLELNRLKAQPQIDSIRAEVDSVRQERDASGRYLYPEMHDTEYLSSVIPHVEAEMRATHGMSYKDAFKKAVLVKRGKLQLQPVQGVPAAVRQTNVNQPSGSMSSGSVRGRSAAPNGKVDIIKDAPLAGSIQDDWDYISRSM